MFTVKSKFVYVSMLQHLMFEESNMVQKSLYCKSKLQHNIRYVIQVYNPLMHMVQLFV